MVRHDKNKLNETIMWISVLYYTNTLTTGVHVASLANIIPALILTTLATTGVHVASLANIIPALILTTLA
jgi:hypothetical protein